MASGGPVADLTLLLNRLVIWGSRERGMGGSDLEEISGWRHGEGHPSATGRVAGKKGVPSQKGQG